MLTAGPVEWEGAVSYAAIMGVTAVLAVGAVAYLYFKDVGGGK